MRVWSRQQDQEQDIAVLLFPRFSNHCVANAVEPLRAANELLMRDFYRWNFVSLDGETVNSSSGMPVVPHRRLRDHPGGAILFVVSSYDAASLATTETSRALRAAAKKFDIVIGMDTGAWLMAEAGLLEGKSATIHWDELDGFAESFDTVNAVAKRFVVDGNRITCGGAMTTFDCLVDLIGRAHGEALKLEVSAFFLYQSNPVSKQIGLETHLSALIEASINLMSQNLENPLSIVDVSDRVDVTQRTLSRAFRSELGAPPMKVYQRLRLATARRLAEQSTYSIAEIAVRCGYRNPAAMTRAFVEQFGISPSVMRNSSQQSQR